jgi:hypothetical protein
MFQNILVGEVRKDKESSEMSPQPHIFLAGCQLRKSQRSKEKESPHLKKAQSHYFIYFQTKVISHRFHDTLSNQSNIPSFSQRIQTKVIPHRFHDKKNTPSISPLASCNGPRRHSLASMPSMIPIWALKSTEKWSGFLPEGIIPDLPAGFV